MLWSNVEVDTKCCTPHDAFGFSIFKPEAIAEKLNVKMCTIVPSTIDTNTKKGQLIYLAVNFNNNFLMC